jgi:hypothetical protein
LLIKAEAVEKPAFGVLRSRMSLSKLLRLFLFLSPQINSDRGGFDQNPGRDLFGQFPKQTPEDWREYRQCV